MSKKKNLIRESDRVRIINPEVVLRVGYPLSKEDVKNAITTEQRDAIRNILKICNLKPDYISIDHDLFSFDEHDSEVFGKILDVVSYHMLKSKRFGGKERKLHTVIKESLRNKCGTVVKRRVVKTGTYHSGGVSTSYYGGYDDYCPPYLENEKTHVLFQVYLEYYDDVCSNINADGGIWIDKNNLTLYSHDAQQKELLCQ